jgi:hypothetical protein
LIIDPLAKPPMHSKREMTQRTSNARLVRMVEKNQQWMTQPESNPGRERAVPVQMEPSKEETAIPIPCGQSSPHRRLGTPKPAVVDAKEGWWRSRSGELSPFQGSARGAGQSDLWHRRAITDSRHASDFGTVTAISKERPEGHPQSMLAFTKKDRNLLNTGRD